MQRVGMISLLAGMVLLGGCDLAAVSSTGSENVITEEHDLDGFDSVWSSHGFQVTVSMGDAHHVVTRIDDGLSEHLRVTVDNGTLRLEFAPNVQLDQARNVTIEADVTVPRLAGLSAGAGSHVKLEDIASDAAFAAQLTGGSHLNGAIQSSHITMDLAGGSHATLSGQAEGLVLTAGGGSHAKLGDLPVGDADVTASGGSHATVHVSGTLNAKSSGGSHVKYRGEPAMGEIDEDASSSINRD